MVGRKWNFLGLRGPLREPVVHPHLLHRSHWSPWPPQYLTTLTTYTSSTSMTTPTRLPTRSLLETNGSTLTRWSLLKPSRDFWRLLDHQSLWLPPDLSRICILFSCIWLWLLPKNLQWVPWSWDNVCCDGASFRRALYLDLGAGVGAVLETLAGWHFDFITEARAEARFRIASWDLAGAVGKWAPPGVT